MTAMIQGMYIIGADATLSYSDKGSGANCDVQFWNPNYTKNTFLPLGDICESCPKGSGAWLYGKNPRGQTLFVAPLEGQEDMLTHPQGFVQLWTDKGTGADENGAVWSMTPQEGYVAIGHVVTRASSGNSPPEPDKNNYWCVKSELITTAQLGPQIWNTNGSGAKNSLGVWQMVPKNAGEFTDAATFFATTSTSPTDVTAYVLLPGVVQFG